MLLPSLIFLAAGPVGCRIVNSDQILIRDLAAVEPEFSTVQGDFPVAYSPLPGATRVMSVAELARLAVRYGVGDGEFHNLCFQRAMRVLAEQEVLDVLQRSLAMPGAKIQLVDFSRCPAPVGEIVFPRSGLALTPSAVPLLWKGYVLYGEGNHFPVWARVKVRARLFRVVATDNLVTGAPVRSDQVRVEPLDGAPDALAPAQSLDCVVGKTLLRPVRRGTTVSLDDLSTAIMIKRGDRVDVDFETPGMRLRFPAMAEADGRFGEHIKLRNLQSHQTFVAEVSGKDQASVHPTREANDSSTVVRLVDSTVGR